MKMAKPEPEIFKAILDDAGIEPEETLLLMIPKSTAKRHRT